MINRDLTPDAHIDISGLRTAIEDHVTQFPTHGTCVCLDSLAREVRKQLFPPSARTSDGAARTRRHDVESRISYVLRMVAR